MPSGVVSVPCAGSTFAVNPSMSDAGNGHGWLPRYTGSTTRMPDSSNTSRTTADSSDSPGSTNPASSE